MKLGDFTALAQDYEHRPGYSPRVLRTLLAATGLDPGASVVADVGAGTGKLTEGLAEIGLRGWAIEPNEAMRTRGQIRLGHTDFVWRAGTAEQLGLADGSVDWILMASAFHWTEPQRALAEFARVLKPGGFVTLLWNPRDIARCSLTQTVERRIREIVPELRRVSSGAADYTTGLEDTLLASGAFADLVFVEAPHREMFTPERYVGVWRSVNDIQVQAGPERFAAILEMIVGEVAGMEQIAIPYRTRAWTVRLTLQPGRAAA